MVLINHSYCILGKDTGSDTIDSMCCQGSVLSKARPQRAMVYDNSSVVR